MGLLDKIKSLLSGNADKVKGGLDKAGEMIDDKTGRKYGDKIDMATDKADEMIDKLDEGAGDATEK